MSSLTIVALILVGFFVILALARLTGKGAMRSVDEVALVTRLKTESNYRGMRSPLDDTYQEVLRLAEVELPTGETVMAACGVRGEAETVLMATNHRLFLFTRRFSSGKYHTETFDYRLMRPIPISQSVIGSTVRVLEGSRIAEFKSPGAESWMDTAEDTIRIINKQISAARVAAGPTRNP